MDSRDLDSYRDEYLNNHGFEKEMVEYRRRNLLEILAKYAPKKILEVGCGTESLAVHYENFTDFTIVEPIKDFLSIARERLGDKVCYINKKIEDAMEDLKKKDFDFIVVSSLIHELKNPETVFETVREIASSETVVHINTPNANSIHRLLGVKMGLLKNTGEMSDLARKFQRSREYEMSDLVSLAQAHGFQTLDKGSYFLKPLSHGQMRDLLESGKISKKFLDGVYKISNLLPENGSEIFVNLQLKEN
ncbi:class I SAM-dependent methyltransferase [Candidatus Mycalebacterium sp.]